MATGNRKRSATGKKSSSGRKTNSGHKRNTKNSRSVLEFTRGILWIVVAVSLLPFISNFDLVALTGGTVSRFFFVYLELFAIYFNRITGGNFFCCFEPETSGSRKISGGHFDCSIMYVFELISDGTDAKKCNGCLSVQF